MEATSVSELPVEAGWQYEPKWDGFRCLSFRDGKDVFLQSKSGQPFARYFPEVVETLRRMKSRRFVLDGELVVPVDGQLSFDSLLQRIHPAASRVARLARETPAVYLVFDLLEHGRQQTWKRPLSERRSLLESFAKSFPAEGVQLSPATTDLSAAKHWWKQVGQSLDGIVCKRLDSPYQFGSRDEMVKVKRKRTADCVVGGFRYAAKEKIVGSLLLGLFDDDGKLHHVGYVSAISHEERAALTPKVEKLAGEPGFTGRAPGGPSRWSTRRSSEWVPLKSRLVVEVEYDHFTGGRFRHGTKLVRWRPDKKPQQCTMSQVAPPVSVASAFLKPKG
jgi:ATP-dependent DNA ligase